MKLNLKKPIVFFDLETTGTDICKDRIVEISLLKLYPDGREESTTMRINPEMHIPEASTAVHGIKDEDVADCPTFKQVASDVMRYFEGADVAGFNSNRFDLPVLAEELLRVGKDLCLNNSRFVDILSCEDEIIGRDISTDLKACKNPVELEGMRRSHIMDGIAFANAFSKVDFSKVDGTYDEIAISDLFACERAKLPGYLGPSFNPISGFGEHGAMCHYSASPESNARIDHDGLLVLDTGSQFEYGMTDLTRTLLFGEATAEQKKDYTLTLKGHLALARARFIHPTRGYQLDVLAKQFMWKEGESFYHGTGHGVGFNLNVHEGPMRISTAPIDVVLEEGMVLSDEPGIYKEGRHGIRIENLLAVQKDIVTEFGQFMCFEVLSLVPYEKRLIDISMLTSEEVGQIDAYHKRVYEELVDKVEPSAVDWLREATRPLAACGDK